MELRSDKTYTLMLVLEPLLELTERVFLCIERRTDVIFSDTHFFCFLISLVVLSIMKSANKTTFRDV